MKFRPILLGATLALLVTACTAGQSTPESSEPGSAGAKLTVLTHDSFELPDNLLAQFAQDTGYTVNYVTLDSGALVNQLILTKDSPLGDVVYGIDNTFSSRAVSQGILQDYTSPVLPKSAADLALPQLTPINFGDVCLNADTTWFQAKGLPVPTTLEDLTRAEYRDLTVLINPTGSGPGLAFLLATIGAKGDAWPEYWQALKDNGVHIAASWSEAYFTEFSGADGKGPRPIVLSYATSPAYTVTDGVSTTQALLETCFRQVEYAGIINGTQNEQGAQKFIDFMLSDEVQAAIPENMYMYPANTTIDLPADWVAFAPLSTQPIEISSPEISTHRDHWLQQWSEAIG